MKIYESSDPTDRLVQGAKLEHLILEYRVGDGVDGPHQLPQKHSASLREQLSLSLCQQRHLNIILASPSLEWNWICNKSNNNMTVYKG